MPKRRQRLAAAGGTAISVRNLRVNYGEREILHGINFEVPAGETHGDPRRLGLREEHAAAHARGPRNAQLR